MILTEHALGESNQDACCPDEWIPKASLLLKTYDWRVCAVLA